MERKLKSNTHNPLGEQAEARHSGRKTALMTTDESRNIQKNIILFITIIIIITDAKNSSASEVTVKRRGQRWKMKKREGEKREEVTEGGRMSGGVRHEDVAPAMKMGAGPG